MKVKVYFNLYKKCLSVLEKRNGSWLLKEHVNSIVLSDVEFKASEAGRQRVLATKRKNVHAFIIGDLCGPSWPFVNCPTARYNPYKYSTFVDKDEKPLYRADCVRIEGRKIEYVTA